MQALSRPFRVLRPGGSLLPAGNSRFASLLEDLLAISSTTRRSCDLQADFSRRDNTQSRSTILTYCTTTFFHHPERAGRRGG